MGVCVLFSINLFPQSCDQFLLSNPVMTESCFGSAVWACVYFAVNKVKQIKQTAHADL